MRREEKWALLLRALRATYVVSEPTAGRVLVSSSGRHQPPLRVEVVMTPKEFDDIVAMPFGSREAAIGFVLARLAAQPADAPYLVYDHYDLVPSTTPEPPPDPDEL